MIVNAQANLTKEEVLLLWNSTDNKTDTAKDVRNYTFDVKSDKRIISFMDSLNNRGIDSIIIYSIAYPGYISINPCIDYSYPVYTYLLWMTGKEINIKAIKGKCESFITTLDSFYIFDVYRSNEALIAKETVMPVIFSAQRTKDDRIIYSIGSIDHEPKYSIFFLFGKNAKTVNFTQDDMLNKKSMFHLYNQGLKTIQVWKLIRKIVGDRE